MFWKDNEHHKSSISEVIDSERWAYLNASEGLFWKPFGSKCVNESENLLKSAKKVLLSYFFIIVSEIELENVVFNQIWDFRTGW